MTDENKFLDFNRMDIGAVEALVGRKVDDVQVKGRWISCLFKGQLAEGICNAPITISFKKW